MKSNKFDLVKKYYDKGHWKIGAVYNAVIKGWITAAEYEEITDKPFPVGEDAE